MGWRRSSNLEDRPNFHLRKTVQRIATPATEDATIIITVMVVLSDLAALDPTCGGAVSVPVSMASTDSVRVDVDGGATAFVGSGAPMTFIGSEVGAAGLALDAVEDVLCDDSLVLLDSDTELLEDSLAELDSEVNED